MKKLFEILLILFGMYIIIYFILYISYFDNYCVKKSQNVRDYRDLNLLLLKECKDSFVCEYNYNDHKYFKGKLIRYSCAKDIVKYFELSFYKKLIK